MRTSSAAPITSRLAAAARILPVTMLLAGALLGASVAHADQLDSDGDGLFDQDEISVYMTDPMNADTDGDGYLDGDEVFYASDPLNQYSHNQGAERDTDQDGLYDMDETGYYGTDPNNADTDGDLITDGLEVYNNSDPLVVNLKG